MDPKPWRITPYKKHPSPPLMCLLTNEGKVVDEFGDPISLDDFPSIPCKVFTSYDTARHLILEGNGEALCWNNEEIRWRHNSFEENEWKVRKTDVSVLRIPFPESDEKALSALGKWRDWLSEYRAAPIGTTGGAAWSLLRATIRKPFWINSGNFPPFLNTMGGRIELGNKGPGRYEGEIQLLDLPAAYANAIGSMRYGGKWFKASEYPGGLRSIDYWAANNQSVFVQAEVDIPELMYGPLVDRPNHRISFLHSLCLNYYPKHGKLTGIWTLEELRAAELVGVRILKVIEIWVHKGGQLIFSDWWKAVVEGRKIPGFANHLIKMTGNALWGRFAMDGENGRKSIRKKEKGAKEITGKPLVFTTGIPPDHALAETISGRIRAKLGIVMHNASNNLISAHTDGAWIIGRNTITSNKIQEEWRQKNRASRLDILSPQAIRYWPSMLRSPNVMLAGYPPTLAPEVFERHWSRYERKQYA